MAIFGISNAVNAQGLTGPKETYNWTFGSNAGLTWNTTRSYSVSPLAGGATGNSLPNLPTIIRSSLDTTEGCFSISDSNGALLFYSDGISIFDKSNNYMQNGGGLIGNPSSAQSGIVVPYPGNSKKYLAVSIGQYTDNNLSYSIVDMNSATNGGYPLGAVTSKNNFLTGGSGGIGESVTSIRHRNGVDYWIVAPGRGGTTYLNAWRMTSTGISGAPTVAPINIATAFGSGNISGYIKLLLMLNILYGLNLSVIV